MVRILPLANATELSLPGRVSHEIVSANHGARSVTLRRVEIPVRAAGASARGRHSHADFEECIYVLSGRGTTSCDSGDFPVSEGDTILIPPGELHATENTGDVPLVLLCFFPVGDIRSATHEQTRSSSTAVESDAKQ